MLYLVNSNFFLAYRGNAYGELLARGYDGASNMCGVRSGVKTKVLPEYTFTCHIKLLSRLLTQSQNYGSIFVPEWLVDAIETWSIVTRLSIIYCGLRVVKPHSKT